MAQRTALRVPGMRALPCHLGRLCFHDLQSPLFPAFRRMLGILWVPLLYNRVETPQAGGQGKHGPFLICLPLLTTCYPGQENNCSIGFFSFSDFSASCKAGRWIQFWIFYEAENIMFPKTPLFLLWGCKRSLERGQVTREPHIPAIWTQLMPKRLQSEQPPLLLTVKIISIYLEQFLQILCSYLWTFLYAFVKDKDNTFKSVTTPAFSWL